MRTASLVTIILLLALLFIGNRDTCSFALGSSDETPRRLVIIQGKATIINLPGAGEVPATSETLIFQKVGCESCFDGANVDVDGNYQILVSDGKYKIIVGSPSAPEVDLLAPNQERYIDTGSDNSSNAIFNFDIKIKVKLSGNADKIKG